MDIRKRAFKIPPLGKKAKLVCIPTSSGTGSEVTPFAVITDHKTGYKYPSTDYALTPSVAIVDPALARTQPRLAHLRRRLGRPDPRSSKPMSPYGNDFTDAMALQGVQAGLGISRQEPFNGDQRPARPRREDAQRLHHGRYGVRLRLPGHEPFDGSQSRCPEFHVAHGLAPIRSCCRT